MTEETAKKVFDLLLSEIRSNGFTDIGTFMMDEVQKENEYEQFDEKYEYVDGEKTIANYEALSNHSPGAKIALRRLVNAGIDYFRLAYQIPDRYAERLHELTKGNNISSQMNMEGVNEEVINVNNLLKNKSVKELLELLEKIQAGFDRDDEAFLNSID